MVDALPPGARQIREPGAGGGEQVRHVLPGGRRNRLLAARPARRLRHAGQQRVVDGAEQRGAGGGEREEVILARDSLRRLLGRLRGPGGQRRSRDGVGELRQPGGLGGRGAEQAGDEGPVEGVDGRQGFVEPVGGLTQQAGPLPALAPGSTGSALTAAALVGGNHCISGNGAVVGASSR